MKKALGLIIAGIVAIAAIIVITKAAKDDHSQDRERIEGGARQVS